MLGSGLSSKVFINSGTQYVLGHSKLHMVNLDYLRDMQKNEQNLLDNVDPFFMDF